MCRTDVKPGWKCHNCTYRDSYDRRARLITQSTVYNQKSDGNIREHKLEKGSYLHIQTVTPAGHMPGLRSSSAGPSSSCRMGWRTQSGIQGSDPEPESPEASGGHTPSGGAALQDMSQTDNLNLIRNK